MAGRRALVPSVAPQLVILQEGDLAGVNDLPRGLGASLIEMRLATRTRIFARPDAALTRVCVQGQGRIIADFTGLGALDVQ